MEVASDRRPLTSVSHLDRARMWLEPASSWLYGFLVVSLVAGSTGGYLATTQGWAAVTTLWLAAVLVLVRDELSFGLLEGLFVGGLTAFTGWVALSAFWSPSVTSTMHEVQRDLAYVGIAAAGVLVVRQRTVPHLLGGVLAAVTLLAAYSLGTRLLPDRMGDFDSESFGYRLASPITYWNGLGIFAVVGILLALGVAARAKRVWSRGLAAAVVPLLVTTMYFTFSRGAWVALAVGVVASVLVDPRRLQLLAIGIAIAPWSALAIVAIDRRPALTTFGSSFGDAVTQGHSLVTPLVGLSLISGSVGAIAALLERRVRISTVVRLGFAVALLALLVAAAGVTWREEGSPSQLADRAWSSFQAPPTVTSPDVSQRLFQLSSNGRVSLWKVSWESFEREPLLGSGAGTYWQVWVKHRDVFGSSTEGHSLYLEVLGEMGIPGLALLLVSLSIPLLAGVRARATALAPAALGAYVAWAAHAGVDWDWELAGVTSAALLVGVALLRAGPPRWRRGGVPRAVLFVACLVLSIAAVVGLMGDLAIDRAAHALGRDEPATALRELDRAARWAPWSSQPEALRASTYIVERKPALARRAYRRAIAKDEDSWLLWNALATLSTGAERRNALAEVRRLSPPLP